MCLYVLLMNLQFHQLKPQTVFHYTHILNLIHPTKFTCSGADLRLSHPMNFSSPIMAASARFASSNAFWVLRAIAE